MLSGLFSYTVPPLKTRVPTLKIPPPIIAAVLDFMIAAFKSKVESRSLKIPAPALAELSKIPAVAQVILPRLKTPPPY
jgi:hypothetical protein